ncbi:MAG TPA: PRC-barrel domain-containing protein [Verrucomicrobiae bacterium]
MKAYGKALLFAAGLACASVIQGESRQLVGVPQRATDIMGMEVRNLADEKLGKVEDLIVNIGAGKTSYVILSSGGVFGLGDQLIVVPAQRFNYREHDKKLILDADKDLLKGAPGYDKHRLPDWSDEAWNIKLEEYYDRFGRAPVVTERNVAGAIKEVPAKERVTRADTVEGQGSSERDVQITRSIRKHLVDSNLSTMAKNVQVITRHGNVTLRGKVKSEEEREEIVARAKQVAGLERVTDRIELWK